MAGCAHRCGGIPAIAIRRKATPLSEKEACMA